MSSSKDSIAIMQPYVFPYIGYFQLIHAVDTFVFYDDVNYIKKGWFNRNKILVNGTENTFTIPLQKASQNNLINETLINLDLFDIWKRKFLKTLEHSYKKAQFFQETYDLVNCILNKKTEKLSELAIHSVIAICDYLNQPIEYSLSSVEFDETIHMERAERLKEICHKKHCLNYINPIGGQKLYAKSDFMESGINLKFLNPTLKKYRQFEDEFMPSLSIIDVLMFNSPDACRDLLKGYTIE